MGLSTDKLFATLANALERPTLADDPRYASNRMRMDNWKDLHDDLEAALQARSSRE
jgi:crotonobetainyl-CoA:carnitine CoA-transferase CaiB-like acyl-CoA transferase